MAKQVRDARVLLKRTIGNASPVVPVIGPSVDHTDGTWASNNVYMGELFLDTMFNKMWVITDTSNNPQEVVMYDENDLNLKGTIRLTDLPPSISSHILYYDDATGHVSYGLPDTTSVNLDISTDDDTVTVTNSSGTDAIIPAATDSIAGVMTINYQEFSGNKFFNGNISADSMSSNSISSLQVTANTLRVGTATNKATISYTTNIERTLTIPNVGGNRTFSFINQAETFSAVKTFTQTPVFQSSIDITNNSNSDNHIILNAALFCEGMSIARGYPNDESNTKNVIIEVNIPNDPKLSGEYNLDRIGAVETMIIFENSDPENTVIISFKYLELNRIIFLFIIFNYLQCDIHLYIF